MSSGNLESRIKGLEDLVFGDADKDSLYPRAPMPLPQCIDSLVSMHSQLWAATAGRKKIAEMNSKLKLLQKYLDPTYADKITESEDARINIILAEEQFIRQQCQNLEALHEESKVMDSEHIKAASTMAGRLQELKEIHIKQQDMAGELTEDTKHLFDTYNNVISLLSKQFTQWDETITRFESASMPKKVLD